MMLNIFDWFTLPLENWVETGVDWLVTNYRFIFQAIKWPIDKVLVAIRDFLLWVNPVVVIAVMVGIAWKYASRGVAVFTLLALLLLGYTGVWEEAMITLSMILASVIFCIVVGIPLGILLSQSDRLAGVIRPVLDIMQSTPAFVYLVPVVMLFSIGTVAGVIATIVFAIPPTIKLTNLGIRQVHPELIEAGLACGATRKQILLRIQLPLAKQTIMAGLNQTIMLSLAMVVIASLIGAGGLGVLVFEGVNSMRVGLAVIGGLGIVLIAIVLDRITQSLAGKR
ncbi:MAG: ABC transporter permease [Desulfonatronovibrionaceae bacterium]